MLARREHIGAIWAILHYGAFVSHGIAIAAAG